MSSMPRSVSSALQAQFLAAMRRVRSNAFLLHCVLWVMLAQACPQQFLMLPAVRTSRGHSVDSSYDGVLRNSQVARDLPP
jgi:hypothetical protein